MALLYLLLTFGGQLAVLWWVNKTVNANKRFRHLLGIFGVLLLVGLAIATLLAVVIGFYFVYVLHTHVPKLELVPLPAKITFRVVGFLLSFLAEFLVLRKAFKLQNRQALLYTAVMVAISYSFQYGWLGVLKKLP